MGRGKHCTPEERSLIRQLLKEGKTYKIIQEMLKCSAKMISNAKKWKSVPEKRGGKRKTTPQEDRNIINCSKKEPFKTPTQIKQELDLHISTSSIRRRLIKANLRSRRPRKVPLLNSRQIKNRLSFAREHELWPSSKWRNILWSDESKVVLFDSSGCQKHVRRPACTEFKPKYTRKTVKHGDCSLMVWGCFSWYGVGPIHCIKGKMDSDVYVNILQNVMLPFAEEEMPLKWTYMQDNDPKHTSRKAKKWFEENKVSVMVWPSQSPDLNPIEHLWVDVKKAVSAAKPQNTQQLWDIIQSAWRSIPVNRCRQLVESMPRRCTAVIRNNGHGTKY